MLARESGRIVASAMITFLLSIRARVAFKASVYERSCCRRRFLLALVVWLFVPLSVPLIAANAEPAAGSPNVIVILTDDQGHGDLGFHVNPVIRTPNLDRLARAGARFTRFYVSPVCSPTRASLLTGRYNYRTGVVDTYIGRSLMHPDELTLAEIFGEAGYQTGIFGKWHLGDNYPMRPIDQGFREAWVHKGGGIGQPSDPPGGESYFDPILQHNGEAEQTRGYCSDVYTDAAVGFIERHRTNRFFVWLAFNAPHTPLEVPERYEAPYRQMNLASEMFPEAGQPIPSSFSADTTAKIYGMVENIDDNVGRLLERLDTLNLTQQTLVVFLSDNGPQQPRYNSGLRGLKGTFFEGGIRAPCFMRWPGQIPADQAIDRVAAHIDVAPTLLDICRIPKPAGVRFDGLSLWPLVKDPQREWPERTLMFQWHRGDAPQLHRAFTAVTQDYKLIQPDGTREGLWTNTSPFLLFDLSVDPFERHDLSAARPEVMDRLMREYERWFEDVTGARNYHIPSRILLGTPHENPTILTRQDWRGPEAGWGERSRGHWDVEIVRGGEYQITLHFASVVRSGMARIAIAGTSARQPVSTGATSLSFRELRLEAGSTRLEAWLEAGDVSFGPKYAVVQRVR